jgi:hypothetical protein
METGRLFVFTTRDCIKITNLFSIAYDTTNALWASLSPCERVRWLDLRVHSLDLERSLSHFLLI